MDKGLRRSTPLVPHSSSMQKFHQFVVEPEILLILDFTDIPRNVYSPLQAMVPLPMVPENGEVKLEINMEVEMEIEMEVEMYAPILHHS